MIMKLYLDSKRDAAVERSRLRFTASARVVRDGTILGDFTWSRAIGIAWRRHCLNSMEREAFTRLGFAPFFRR